MRSSVGRERGWSSAVKRRSVSRTGALAAPSRNTERVRLYQTSADSTTKPAGRPGWIRVLALKVSLIHGVTPRNWLSTVTPNDGANSLPRDRYVLHVGITRRPAIRSRTGVTVDCQPALASSKPWRGVRTAKARQVAEQVRTRGHRRWCDMEAVCSNSVVECRPARSGPAAPHR